MTPRPAPRVLRAALGPATPPSGARRAADAAALEALLRAERPDVVHVVALAPAAAALLDVLAAHGLRVVVAAPLVLTPEVRAAVVRCAHAVHPPSPAAQETLLAQGLPADLVAGAGDEGLERALAGAPPPPRPARPVAVDWVGDHVSKASLATVNRRVGAVLGPEVDLRRVGRVAAPEPPRAVPADVEVRHTWPPDLAPPPAGRLALVQPWEFGAIPEAWVEALREDVDEVWVPSAHVARMYLAAGLEADRVHVLPNGVDLDVLRPDGPALELDAPAGLRVLFVGGWIWRKGGDVLLDACARAFAGRDDVTLVVKDFGAAGVYRGASRADLLAAVEAGRAGGLRVLHLTDELDDEEMAALFRACDVLVHPYRGEGFAMPVLEAMACGLPVVTTAGGPTDEFCPPEAGWRIASRRVPLPGGTVDGMPTAGEPWVLEPDADHLVELLRAADADPAGRRARGHAGRRAAEALSWEAVGARYAQRLAALAAREPRLARPRGAGAPVAWPAPATLRVLAVPAWRGEDRLAELLGAWAAAVPAGTGACLELLADPATDGEPAALEAHVLAAVARAGVDLESCADIDVFMCPATPDRDVRVHAEVDAYVALHDGAPGHARLARRVLEPTAAALRGLHPSPHLPAEEAA